VVVQMPLRARVEVLVVVLLQLHFYQVQVSEEQ
jgi:hypothetical protein